MYAIAMGADDGRLVVARDPVGIKPLYWAQKDGLVRFASEMAAFEEEWQPQVEPFPPGHAWTPEDGLVRFAHAVPETLGRIPGPLEPGASAPTDILHETRDVLVEAVERQLMPTCPSVSSSPGGSTRASSPPSPPVCSPAPESACRPPPWAPPTRPISPRP